MNPPNPPGPPAPIPPPGRAPRQIRGPQSALTDFLATHNISANQIRQDANARRAAALASQQAANGDNDNEDEDGPDDNAPPSPSAEPEPAPRRKKKETKAQLEKRLKEEKAIAKIKASKQFKRRRAQRGSDEDMSDEDAAARAAYEEVSAPLPGQMENCEICDKRFTVTAYSRAGPDGGLLCPKCTKELDKEEGAAKKKRKTNAGTQKRQVRSAQLDGTYRPGAKNLVTICVETLAKNVDQAEDFGDIPAHLIDRLAQILSKKRIMSSDILQLFLRPDYDTVTVYDGSKLSSDDYIRIFQIMPKIKHVRLRNAVQFKNKVMDHLLGTVVELESLSLHGSNLIDDERWNQYLSEKGSHLRSLKIYSTDNHFGDEQLELLHKTCPKLTCLKISHNQRVTDVGLKQIANLKSLERLSLEIYKTTSSEPYVEIINSTGSTLRTLSLATVHYIDDTVLDATHNSCQNIRKLRITDNEVLTDAGFAKLFTNWNNVPLEYVDFHKCRHLDSTIPRDNPDGIGFSSLGFQALMAHSGAFLRLININSCRHISLEAFETVFAADKKYPELREMNLSFCQQVNDFIVGSIWRACPELKFLKVFGCFGVSGDIRIPKGRILIGVPTAKDMKIEGTEEGEEEICAA